MPQHRLVNRLNLQMVICSHLLCIGLTVQLSYRQCIFIKDNFGHQQVEIPGFHWTAKGKMW